MTTKTELSAFAEVATKLQVDAVGREYPDHKVKAGGYRYTVPGKWYVVRGGQKQPASAAEARALNRVGATGYGSIGPVSAQ